MTEPTPRENPEPISDPTSPFFRVPSRSARIWSELVQNSIGFGLFLAMLTLARTRFEIAVMAGMSLVFVAIAGIEAKDDVNRQLDRLMAVMRWEHLARLLDDRDRVGGDALLRQHQELLSIEQTARQITSWFSMALYGFAAWRLIAAFVSPL